MKPIKSMKSINITESKRESRTSNSLQIMIKQVEDKEGEYIAYYRSEFLNATYLVYFRDNIFGSVALHEFSEMIKSKYRESEVKFEISNEKVKFKSRALLEAMSGSKI